MTRADLDAIKQGINLLSLIGQATELRRVATTGEGEYAGPCPFCGGRDRFRVQPNYPEGGRWFCRVCTGDPHSYGTWKDAFDYIMKRDGCEFKEALAEARQHTGQLPLPTNPAPRPRPQTNDNPPPADWQAKALAFVVECEGRLWTDAGQRARAWLKDERGLNPDTLQTWRLGYCAQDGYYGGLWAFRGIVLPWFGADHLWRVQIRRPQPDPRKRYAQLSGASGNCPGLYGVQHLTGKPDCLLAEGELDTLLAWQELGAQVDVVSLGSASGRVADRWLPVFYPVSRLLVATDNDEGGHKAAIELLELFRHRAWRAMPPDGAKDIGEAWQAGADLREWLNLILRETGQG